MLYICSLAATKVCICGIFQIVPWMLDVGDWALCWTAGNERLQIACVMMICPLILNTTQYCITDYFIKRKRDFRLLPFEDLDARHQSDDMPTPMRNLGVVNADNG